MTSNTNNNSNVYNNSNLVPNDEYCDKIFNREKKNKESYIYKLPVLNSIMRLYFYLIEIKKRFDNWLDKEERRIILKKLMEDALTYEEWKNYAKEVDILEGKEQWKSIKESNLYDHKEVEKLIKILMKKREIKDISGLVHSIRVNLMKNLYSTSNPVLYQACNYGTKYLIEDFQEEMLKSLEYIANFNEKIFPLNKKLEFFSETRHSYGRTALLLSGGASLGMFHSGVIKSLYEMNILPRILCGSSAGSIIASLVCTNPYDKVNSVISKDLKLGPFEFKDKKYSLFRKIYRYITRGVLLDVEVLREFLRENIGDSTFQEAYDKTGWILNITVTGYKEHDNHRVLNYLTAPNVLIWSASCASCCIPGLYDPVELLCKNEYGHIVAYQSNKKKFIDGTISQDLPMQRISELFNVNIFLVSQTNPYVIPFLDSDDNKQIFSREKNKFNLWKLTKNLIFSEIKHRCQQLASLGLLPSPMTRSMNIITQDYRGHVTIFPVPNLSDYLKVLANPSKEDIAYCTLHSSRRTFPNNIVKFEFALEKHHKRLKTKLNKFNLPFDKKYVIDDQEVFDDFHSNLIKNNAHLYNTEERKQLNINLQDIFNVKTEFFSNSSNAEGNALLPLKNVEDEFSDEKGIIDKYNKIIFYNEEQNIIFKDEQRNVEIAKRKNCNIKFSLNSEVPNDNVMIQNGNLNYVNPNNNNKYDNYINSDFSDNFSNISPLISHVPKRSKFINHQSQKNIVYIPRHDSFTLPRCNSKL